MDREQQIIDAINSQAIDILSMSCVITALLEQLKESQGASAVEAAKQKALQVSTAHIRPSGPQPAREKILALFP